MGVEEEGDGVDNGGGRFGGAKRVYIDKFVGTQRPTASPFGPV